MSESTVSDKFKYDLEANSVESVTASSIEDPSSDEVAAKNGELSRSLTTRQISMIAIAGVIGTGLFLGSGKALAEAGPASLLITYAIIGALVYLTMLALGEMNTYMPVAGSFCTFGSRFVDPALGFTLTWNYWFNDAVSTASDLTALQLVFKYWTDWHPWAIALLFWFFLLSLNIVSVKVYGEFEYWLALLKVVSILIFIILGIVVNCGANTSHQYLGFHYWHIEDAPFVRGFRGFASVFVTASFAYGGTESIGITAGESKNPHKTMPRVVRTVFYRILFFYLLTMLIVGINVPWNYPGLSNKSSATSPFTIVFGMAGSKAGGSFINAVVVTSIISAGNHALFAGSRLMYTLAKNGHAPKFLAWLTPNKVPWTALLLTWGISGLCFGASYIGAGELWSWLQNLVGVSNQLSWLCIGFTAIRFRKGLEKQNKVDDLKFKNWTHPWGPWVVVIGSTFIVFVQGWTSFSPWDTSTFFSYYIELIVFPIMFVAWKLFKKTKFIQADNMDLDSDVYVDTKDDIEENEYEASLKGWRKALNVLKSYFF